MSDQSIGNREFVDGTRRPVYKKPSRRSGTMLAHKHKILHSSDLAGSAEPSRVARPEAPEAVGLARTEPRSLSLRAWMSGSLEEEGPITELTQMTERPDAWSSVNSVSSVTAVVLNRLV
jgi:hypothetical protein